MLYFILISTFKVKLNTYIIFLVKHAKLMKTNISWTTYRASLWFLSPLIPLVLINAIFIFYNFKLKRNVPEEAIEMNLD